MKVDCPKKHQEHLLPENNNDSSDSTKVTTCFFNAIKDLKACCFSKDPNSRTCKTLCASVFSAISANVLFASYSPNRSMGDIFFLGLVAGLFGCMITTAVFVQSDEMDKNRVDYV